MNHATKMTNDEAAKFFQNLYRNPLPGEEPVDRGVFYSIATKLIAKSPEQTTVGVTALQALMLNYVAARPDRPTKVRDAALLLAHISRPGAGTFVRAFPDATLEELVEEARRAGYEVEVLTE